jgi:two-component system response regulator CiaR
VKILIVEDDEILSNTIRQCIEKNYDIEQAYDGEEGIAFALGNIYDLIILDIMMPIKNGYEVLREIRSKNVNTPVLILTAKDTLQDKVLGFRAGADDYLVKPFEREELLLRIEAILRRSNGLYAENIIKYKELELNLSNRQAQINGNILNIQGKQFDMLEYLINYKNTIITKDQIFDKIWGFNSETTTNVVEVYASGLRKELKKYEYDQYLKTIRGVGYIWSK